MLIARSEISEHVTLKFTGTLFTFVVCGHYDSFRKDICALFLPGLILTAAAETYLTVWNPTDDMNVSWKEGQRVKIYNLKASAARYLDTMIVECTTGALKNLFSDLAM